MICWVRRDREGGGGEGGGRERLAGFVGRKMQRFVLMAIEADGA